MIILALFLALILLDIALRLYLMSLTALQGRQAFLDKKRAQEGEGSGSESESEGASKGKKPRSKTQKRLTSAAIGAQRVIIRTSRVAVKTVIRAIKWVLRLIRTVISALAVLLGGWVLLIIFVIVLLLGLIGFIVSSPDFGFLDGAQSGSSTSTSAKERPSRETAANCNASIDGLDPEFWKKGDALGQQVACNALQIIQKPPASGLTYSQGMGLPAGYFDCIRFTGMSIAMTGYHQNLVKADIPDYLTVSQDSTEYGSSTSQMVAKLAGHPASAGFVRSSETLLPGDILIRNGHAVVYLGKGTDGKDYLAHASSPGASGSTSVANFISGNKDASDVVVTSDYGFIAEGSEVLRPSLVKKYVDGGGQPLFPY